MLITSLITRYKDAKTPNKESPIVHHGVFEANLLSRKVPSHVKTAIIAPICIPKPENLANFEIPLFLSFSCIWIGFGKIKLVELIKEIFVFLDIFAFKKDLHVILRYHHDFSILQIQ